MFIIGGSNLYAQAYDVFGNQIPESAAKPKTTQPKGDINKTDAQGRKQGVWIKNFENGKPSYKASFVDDKPVGELLRYYPSGKLKAKIIYSGNVGRATMYNETEKMIAKGNYINNKKDSVWMYYNDREELTAREQYVNGLRNGKSFIYYPSGKLSEETNWVNDIKDGPWIQYYESGVVKMKSAYQANKIHGDYTFYFEGGRKEIIGRYYQGIEDGKWYYYLEDGKQDYMLDYDKGVLKNRAEIDARNNKQLQELQKNKDRLVDPELNRNDPDAVMQPH
jgi:antitoxin component YwqK of YwqJK toxin-antitoxin module